MFQLKQRFEVDSAILKTVDMVKSLAETSTSYTANSQTYIIIHGEGFFIAKTLF